MHLFLLQLTNVILFIMKYQNLTLENCTLYKIVLLVRVILKVPPQSHVTPLLKQLHWLPDKFRIEYKTCLLTYKCLNNLATNI